MRVLSTFRKLPMPFRLGFVAAEPAFSPFHRVPGPERGSRTPYYLAGAVVIGLLLAANMPRRTGDEGERELLQRQAESGSARAQLQLGLAYRDGRYGLARDARDAASWFTRAAASGDDYAAALLGDAYAKGDGVARDPTAARRWWRQAALAGNAHAEASLGRALLVDPAGGAHDEGERWLARAAAQGDVRARETLGIDTPAPDRIPDTIDRLLGASPGQGFLGNLYRLMFADAGATGSADALKQRALAGDATVQYQLAMRYRDGAWGVAANPRKALGWLEQSAEHGNPVAMNTLANAYAAGRLGLAPDAAAAASWRKRAEDARADDLGDAR